MAWDKMEEAKLLMEEAELLVEEGEELGKLLAVITHLYFFIIPQ